jgi:hypothetical protein
VGFARRVILLNLPGKPPLFFASRSIGRREDVSVVVHFRQLPVKSHVENCKSWMIVLYLYLFLNFRGCFMRKKNRGVNFAGRLKIKALILTIILPLTVLSFSGCSRNHVKLAEDLARTKKYEEALEQYFKALKANPDRIDLKINIDRQ